MVYMNANTTLGMVRDGRVCIHIILASALQKEWNFCATYMYMYIFVYIARDGDASAKRG